METNNYFPDWFPVGNIKNKQYENKQKNDLRHNQFSRKCCS